MDKNNNKKNKTAASLNQTPLYVALSCIKRWWIGGWLPFMCCCLLSGWEHNLYIGLKQSVQTQRVTKEQVILVTWQCLLVDTENILISFFVEFVWSSFKVSKLPLAFTHWANKHTLFAVPHFSLDWTNMNQQRRDFVWICQIDGAELYSYTG